MLDFSLWEMLLVLCVALLVLGPKRLPHVARTLGRWAAKCRHMSQHVKSEFEQQLQMDELRKRQAQAKAAEEKQDG